MTYHEVPTDPETWSKVYHGRPYLISQIPMFHQGDHILLTNMDTHEGMLLEVRYADSLEMDDVHIIVVDKVVKALPTSPHNDNPDKWLEVRDVWQPDTDSYTD